MRKCEIVEELQTTKALGMPLWLKPFRPDRVLGEVFSRLVITGGGLISLRPLSSCCQVQCSVVLVFRHCSYYSTPAALCLKKRVDDDVTLLKECASARCGLGEGGCRSGGG